MIHEIFSEFLQPFRYVGTQRVAPFFLVVFVFIWFWIFGWLGQRVELDTDAGSESVPHMSALALFSLSLDTVIDGEVDELEEDVG